MNQGWRWLGLCYHRLEVVAWKILWRSFRQNDGMGRWRACRRRRKCSARHLGRWLGRMHALDDLPWSHFGEPPDRHQWLAILRRQRAPLSRRKFGAGRGGRQRRRRWRNTSGVLLHHRHPRQNGGRQVQRRLLGDIQPEAAPSMAQGRLVGYGRLVHHTGRRRRPAPTRLSAGSHRAQLHQRPQGRQLWKRWGWAAPGLSAWQGQLGHRHLNSFWGYKKHLAHRRRRLGWPGSAGALRRRRRLGRPVRDGLQVPLGQRR
mmetsp:Transcript_83222/g.199725  ORF Transcript_83222/g.199725 Transcript_83222/m.199725 type:complete len:259 (+) Transcript_83222:663-1439(+)